MFFISSHLSTSSGCSSHYISRAKKLKYSVSKYRSPPVNEMKPKSSCDGEMLRPYGMIIIKLTRTHHSTYSMVPDKNRAVFIRTSGGIPPVVFREGCVFSFSTPVVFIRTAVFCFCLMMFL